MAKKRTHTDPQNEAKSGYGPESGKGKQRLSDMTAPYVKKSLKRVAKTQVYRGKGETAFTHPAKGLLRSSAVMGPVTMKPESKMTAIEKMKATREGVSKKALEELKEKSGFDYDQLSQVLGVARTTLLNKKGADKFPPGLSEKIMSLADLYSFGYEIFGDPEEFNQWIFQRLPALGGQAPYALLDNHYGREEVKNVVGRIAYGAYS
jgi:putative toxin-antitoxin system antitoxin component (TIGR02293 family)